MSLGDLMANFRAAPATPPAAPATTQGNIPPNTGLSTAATGNTAANGVIPAETDVSTEDNSNPLDSFKDLWQDDPNAAKPDEFGILGEINPQKIAEAAGKVNFARVVKPEDVALIKAGGDEAVAALGRALNSTSQAVYAQSAVASSKLIEQATQRLEAKMDSQLASKFKQHSFSQNLREENPAYNHPAAAPMVSMIEKQMSAKYPNATPNELTKMAQDYFVKTFSAISGEDKKKADASKASPEFDWAEDFGI